MSLVVACEPTRRIPEGDPYVAVELSYFTLYAETSLSHFVSSLNDDLNSIRYTSIARPRRFWIAPEAINSCMRFLWTRKRVNVLRALI